MPSPSPCVCDHCGGPANWTFMGDILHYFCYAECDGFRQLALGLGDGYLDKSVSVSAVPDAEAALWPDEQTLNEQYRRFRNGT